MAARKTESAPPLDDTSRRRLDYGITFAGLCAAAWSAPTLYGLARLIGFPQQLAWLLPAALDGYAATSIWFGKAVPAEHPAAGSARRNSRLALALTIACNGLYHLLTLGGVLVPQWARIALLVVVSSLAPFILDRLLHLRTLAHGTRRPPAAVQTPAPPKPQTGQTATAPGASAEPPDGHPVPHAATGRVAHPPKSSTPTDAPSATQPTMDRWVEVGHPVYVHLKTATGKRPQQGAYRDALAQEVGRLIESGELPETYAEPSLTTAKRVRGAVEQRFPGLSPLHLIQEAS